MNKYGSDYKVCVEAGAHQLSTRHARADCPTVDYEGTEVTLRDVTPEDLRDAAIRLEEGQTIALHDADKSVLVILQPAPPPLVEFYMFRNSEGQWWDARLAGMWTDEINDATIYPTKRPGTGGEWVRFVEAPF